MTKTLAGGWNFGGLTNPALSGDLGGVGAPGSISPADVLGRFLSSWWGVAYVAGGIIFLLYLMWGGIEWAIAGSNKDRIENAKNKISNALIGLLLIAASYALIKLVGFVLGIDILDALTFDLEKLKP